MNHTDDELEATICDASFLAQFTPQQVTNAGT